jgi:hypothetical protein
MLYEAIYYAGTGLVSVPAYLLLFRAVQFRRVTKSGKLPHEFDAHIRKDMHGPHIMRWCDVCQQGAKAWIHEVYSDSDSVGEMYPSSKIILLERDDIKWRFANDLEWVKVFGRDYDPKTFQPIPQHHNGECGGPNDSCERCAWEADQKEADKYIARSDNISVKQAETAEEVAAYEEILNIVWNTVHDVDTAYEEFEDITNELGMLTDAGVRGRVQGLNAWDRLSFCLSTKERYKRWHRREEIWHNEKKRRRKSTSYWDI